MENIANFKTILNDRILCGDGDSIVGLPFLYEYVLKGCDISQVFVSKEDYDTEEVTSYNKKFINDKINCKMKVKPSSLKWNIPKKYKEMNISTFMLEKLKIENKDRNFTDDELRLRFFRIKMEFRIWKKRNLEDMLRTLIFIVNTFEDNKIVWGTGRGSSCASYLLYLVGVHQVDSVEFDLDIGEFFR